MGDNKKDDAEKQQEEADRQGKKPRQVTAEDLPLGEGLAEDAKKALIKRKKLLEDI